MTFMEALRARWERSGSLVCVGLDPEPAKFPARFAGDADAVFAFCRDIVDATAEYACCFKPQFAHYAALGAEGALARLVAHVHAAHPGIPVILDAKRGDIGSTAQQYAREAFERYGAHAVTVNPYMGTDSIEPYLQWPDRGVIVLCRTSNPGGADLQALPTEGGRPLYLRVAELVQTRWNANGQCGLVVGATVPNELAAVRDLVGDDMPLLVPGIGAQGGDIMATVNAGRNRAGTGMMINSSRAILYAGSGKDWREAAAEAARATRDAINAVR